MSEQNTAQSKPIALDCALGTWQPIETAPKSCWPSILVYAGGAMFVATYEDDMWCVTDNKNDYPIRGYRITHWMPLPAPPERT